MRPVARYLLLVLGLLGLLYGVLAWQAHPAPEHPFFADAPRPLVIAHQGGDGLRPGNTLAAFEHAASLGVDVLEMDIHATADGVLVVNHDATVDRTTDGHGAIREMTLAEVQALDAAYRWSPDGGQTFPYRGQGIRIPTLEEVFRAFPGYRMNIEIKPDDPAVAEALCALIHAHGMTERVLVASFHPRAMGAFRRACPEVATSLHPDEIKVLYGLALTRLTAVYTPQGVAVQVPERWSNLPVLIPRFVQAAHRRGLQVHGWTINEPEDMERLLALGVDGIITDYPDRLLRLLGR